MVNITRASRLSAKDSVTIAELDGEAVMLDVATGRYYGLNGVGLAVWQLVTESKSVSEIVARMGEIYEVDRERLRSDVIDFVEKLAEEGLVEVS